MEKKFYKSYFEVDVDSHRVLFIGNEVERIYEKLHGLPYKAAKRIEVSEEDLNNPLPADSVEYFDKEKFRLGFWRYEVVEYEDGDERKSEIVKDDEYELRFDVEDKQYKIRDKDEFYPVCATEIKDSIYNKLHHMAEQSKYVDGDLANKLKEHAYNDFNDVVDTIVFLFKSVKTKDIIDTPLLESAKAKKYMREALFDFQTDLINSMLDIQIKEWLEDNIGLVK